MIKSIIIYAVFVLAACFFACFIGEKIRDNEKGCDFNNCENCTSRAWCNGEVDEWDEIEKM